MLRLRPIWLVAPLLIGACSVINAPEDIDSSKGGGGTTTTGGGGSGGTTSDTSSSSSTTTIATECGDGKIEGSEICDDDNTAAGDGCSATCTIEDGWECTSEPSKCQPTCGNGKLDAGEQCDDAAMGDPNPAPGDQDFCRADCTFQEFDIEAGADNSGVINDLPIAAYRRDGDMPSFYVIWRAEQTSKIPGREYKFDGTYKKGTGAVDIASSTSPEARGEVWCTATSNRSIILWRDADEGQIQFRRVESDGVIGPKVALGFNMPQNNLSCAAAPGGTFIGATIVPGVGGLWDVVVQPFQSSAQAQGTPIDIGDALAPNATAAWPLQDGFMVAWIADPSANGPIVAQQLKATGEVEAGFSFTMTEDQIDLAPREPVGVRIGMQSQFAFVYSRDSAPDVNGNSHRELALRIYQSPGTGGAPKVVATGTTSQSQPAIGVNPTNGKFIVAWTADAPNENVYYRTFSAMGEAVEAMDTIVNEKQPGKQTLPSVVVDPPTGDVVIVWDNFKTNSVTPRKVSAKIFPGLLK